MRRKLLLFCMACLFTFPMLHAQFPTNIGIPSWALQLITDFVAKPDEFFIDLQNDIDDHASTIGAQRVQVYTSLFWDLTTMVNLGLKVHVYDETDYIPRITVGVAGWYAVAFLALPRDIATGRMWGLSPAVSASKTIDENITGFGGFKYMIGNVYMSLGSNIAGGLSASGVPTSINSVYQAPTVFGGFALKTGEKTEAVISGGYIFGKWKPYMQLQYSFPSWNLGVSLYPEAMFVVHPFINFQLKF
ncbi:MAG: hypothetical protein HZC28_19690 [Spirochaetes bacterium]|nr:hypothetical protein [Spirochaetota bacterium]